MQRAIILARSQNHVIGNQNKLPWRLPNELRYFRDVTLGSPVIMGRRTFLSIGHPLVGRTNIVLSRQADYDVFGEGCLVARTLEEAYALAAQGGSKRAFVIGGAQLYADALPTADMLYLTEVHADVEGDVFCPPIAWDAWKRISVRYHKADARHAYAYSFCVYERRKGGKC